MNQEQSPTLERDPLPPPGLESESLALDFRRYFHHTLGRDSYAGSQDYQFIALALTLRDRLMENANRTRHAYERSDSRLVCYLSLEYLLGRSLSNAALNLNVSAALASSLEALGLRLEDVAACEHDAGLGNGGLGRLAACFLDSCATLALPVLGYGIRYRYGMFRQAIDSHGRQIEEPDPWLRDGHPWELERPEFTQRVHFGGRVERYHDEGATGEKDRSEDGRREHRRLHARWVDTEDVLAVPYDVPVPGYCNNTVNTLRLWSAEATDEFDLAKFNAGSYPEAVAEKNAAENITMVLYPNDASENGKALRLRQQYFLASASLKDTLRRWSRRHGDRFEHFADKHCFQLNDTHPSLAVAELMRLLVDEHELEWSAAWDITGRTMAYTNHTLLPEALERWPVRLFGELLPRHLEIIYEINARFLAEVAERFPHDGDRLRRMSIIEEDGEPMVRMAYLAVVGSFSVNGVAALHSELLQSGLFRDFFELWPEKFNNKTNGVTQRRWLAACNPELAALITSSIGSGWVTDLEQLKRLRPLADDADFRDRWHTIKQANKACLAELVYAQCAVRFDSGALFDVQVKRIHEYKRQLLNILHAIHLYQRIKQGDAHADVPRCVLIGGKAAPGYVMAKQIIALINNVARVVNADEDTEGRLRVAFLPNYSVSAMEVLCPGADLSAQLSTAGKEASGTGNMKFMMNGALTIGTLDGANIEIREAAGADNFFLFGLSAEGVETRRADYDPQAIISGCEPLREVMALLDSGLFDAPHAGAFDDVIASIRNPRDPWMTAADFASFVAAQQRVADAWRDRERWIRMSILNCAASGRFSSDRTIGEYNDDIWKLEPVAPVSP